MNTEGIINVKGNRCWRPLCKQENRKIAIVAPWISPANVIVCVYAACEKCFDKIQSTHPLLQSSTFDKVEEHLIQKYPEILKNLPAGYTPGIPSQDEYKN